MAETHDWLTLSEAKKVLSAKASASNSDGVIASVISAASRTLDKAVGPAVRRVVVDEVHSGGGRSVELRSGPVYSISSVVEYQHGSATTLTLNAPGTYPTNGYHAAPYKPQPELNLRSGLLFRTYTGHRGTFWCMDDNIVVNYVGGRYADTASVDARFKEACKVVVKNWFRMYEASVGVPLGGELPMPTQSFPTYAIPNAARLMLRDVWQSYVGFGAS